MATADSPHPRIPLLTLAHKQWIEKHVVARFGGLGAALAVVASPILPRSWRTVERPIFMIGCSRSGTTLVCDALAEHDDIANWSEAGLVFAPDYFDGHIDHVKEAGDATPFQAARLRVLLGLYTRLKRKKRFLNKQQMNSVRVNYLARIFPDARFIHVIRDGRAAVLSTDAKTTRETHRRNIPFGNFPKPPGWRDYLDQPQIERFAHQWAGIVGYVLDQFRGRDRPEPYIEVRYEDFCKDPRGWIRRLDEFCGLAPEGRDLARLDRKFENMSRRSINAASRDDLARIAPIIAPLMERIGYPDPYPPDATVSPAPAAPAKQAALAL